MEEKQQTQLQQAATPEEGAAPAASAAKAEKKTFSQKAGGMWASFKISYARWKESRELDKRSEVKEGYDRSHKGVLITLCVLFSIYALTIFFPLAWMLINSLKTAEQFNFNPWPMPKPLIFTNYTQVFLLFEARGFNFGEMFLNSLALSLTIPTASAFVTACAAYAVARYRFPGRRVLYFIAVSIMFIPTTGSLPMMLRLMNQLHLYDTLPGMIIKGAGAFGFNFLILYGIFSSISPTYAEAARMDGAGNWRIFLQIILPQAKATIFAVWILGFIGNWNDYASAKIFYANHETLAVGLKLVADAVGSGSQDFIQDYPKLFAAVVITVLPVMILFIACQKQIIRLNMGGGIKG